MLRSVVATWYGVQAVDRTLLGIAAEDLLRDVRRGGLTGKGYHPSCLAPERNLLGNGRLTFILAQKVHSG